jgi:hypothetical protein
MGAVVDPGVEGRVREDQPGRPRLQLAHDLDAVSDDDVAGHQYLSDNIYNNRLYIRINNKIYYTYNV